LRPVDLVPSGFLMSGTASGVAGQQEHIEQVQAEQTLLRWPQNNVDDECLWLYKPLSAKAHGFIPDISFRPKLL
jgi:hypothetical protein